MINAINEKIIDPMEDIIVNLDLVYALGVLKGVIPKAEMINQVACTLLDTSLELFVRVKAVGIDHVRVQVNKNVGKAKEVLEDNFDRVIGICAMVLRTAEDIPTQDFEWLFGLTKAQIWQSVPELIRNDGHKFFDVHTPIRQLVKRMSDYNAGKIKI